jgi:hypothetical protein
LRGVWGGKSGKKLILARQTPPALLLSGEEQNGKRSRTMMKAFMRLPCGRDLRLAVREQSEYGGYAAVGVFLLT